jgi:hypothetical protein
VIEPECDGIVRVRCAGPLVSSEIMQRVECELDLEAEPLEI